ncbi:hypothetical protein ACFW5I_03075 [Streptomyces sp. NPDC058818]|uniref:hypothetical protein n=1 Tax=Streptomyces sp. NPDC058818 TaxID=3346640 RepID=UPI0036B92BD0
MVFATRPDSAAAKKIERDIAPSGVNHMICALTDRTLVKAFHAAAAHSRADRAALA